MNNVDSKALEQFRVRLAQAIFWCSRRADLSSPETSLRTPELRPAVLEESRVSGVHTVVNARELLVGREIRNAALPGDVGGGRLLVYFPNDNLYCGAAEQQSRGFFDINNVPPWDTWVAYFQDQQKVDSFDTEFLISWIPPAFIELANDGINVNPEQCIQWLSDTPLELALALRVENLLA